MNKILNIWKNRKLTLIGKINIVKTLALSKLIFNSSNLNLSKNLSDTITSMIFNFIWQGKPPKIERMTIVGEKNKGRLKMVDFEVMNTALKFAWVKRICQNSDSSWKTLIAHFFREHGGLSFLLNCRYDVKLLNLNDVPPFYQAILKCWQENKPIILEDNTHKQNKIIWNNKNILDKHMIYLKQWHRTGIMYTNDMLDENFNFLPRQISTNLSA